MLLQKKPFSRETIISRHPTSRHLPYFGTYSLGTILIGEPAFPDSVRLSLETFDLTLPQFWETFKVVPHQPHIAFKKKEGSYRESLPNFNFLSYLISTANIQLLYPIIAIFDVKYP